MKYNSFRDPTNPFFFILNLALGGDFPKYAPTEGFPAHFEIDWVRVWQQPDGSGYVNTPSLQWVEEERRVQDGEAAALQSSKVRDVRRYKSRKQQNDVKVVRTE